MSLSTVLSTSEPLLKLDDRGLHCAKGSFHIDPWQPVDVALITHAHGDHARIGSRRYLCSEPCLPLLEHRLGAEAQIEALPYGKQIRMGDTVVSFHPAGHILGSSQIRIESKDRVWVVSGDYKRAHDPTCAPFEVVPCDVFITEATFGLPIYRWESGRETAKEVLKWWDANRADNRPSLLFCYALGKAQRLLAEIAELDPKRSAHLHGAMLELTRLYRDSGVRMIDTSPVGEASKSTSFNGELILAPPSAFRSPWMKRFKGADTGFASGWMRVRGSRRRRGYDRGFVLSDHADWNELLTTVKDTGARMILPTHGSTETLSRHLRSLGLEARPLEVTAFEGEGSTD